MKQRRFTPARPQLEALEPRLTMNGPGAGAPVNPGILPPQSTPFGATYGEWSARWWQWAYSLPIDHHPLFDTADVSTGQTGHVWFLGGSFQSTVTPTGQVVAIDTRDATIPAGTALFVPIINSEASTLEGNGTTDAELRAAAKSFQDLASNMSAQIDGRSVQDVGAYRVQSPLFTYGPLPDNNVLQSFGTNAPAGSTSLSVGDGVYLMLAPLSVGTHTIHFHGEVPAFNFLLDITYNLTVAPGGGAGGAADAHLVGALSGPSSASGAQPALSGGAPLGGSGSLTLPGTTFALPGASDGAFRAAESAHHSGSTGTGDTTAVDALFASLGDGLPPA